MVVIALIQKKIRANQLQYLQQKGKVSLSSTGFFIVVNDLRLIRNMFYKTFIVM